MGWQRDRPGIEFRFECINCGYGALLTSPGDVRADAVLEAAQRVHDKWATCCSAPVSGRFRAVLLTAA